MDNYLSYRIPTLEIDKDRYLAWLDFFGFEMIEEIDNYLVAYIQEQYRHTIDPSALAEKLQLSIDKIVIEKVEQKNWNKEWEQNFQAVIVEDKCYIRAEFHEVNSDYPYQIIIKPQMAFGTGHHETTYMMIQQMLEIEMDGKSIFDFGSGTGILSVFALQRGAGSLVAIDIEEPSYTNTLEHLALNGFADRKKDVYLGELEILEDHLKFDLILANINRNVLTTLASDVVSKINPKGQILISGILRADENGIVNLYTGLGLSIQSVVRRGEWVCILFGKNM